MQDNGEPKHEKNEPTENERSIDKMATAAYHFFNENLVQKEFRSRLDVFGG